MVAHNKMMEKKIKKAQVVIAALDQNSRTFEFLLLKTNQKRGSFWQNATGKIEQNETIEEGGLREAIEETHLKVDDIVDMIDLNLSFSFTDRRERKVLEKCFLIILDQKWDVKIDPHEHESFQWVNINNIHSESVKFSSNFEALERAIKILRHWGG